MRRCIETMRRALGYLAVLLMGALIGVVCTYAMAREDNVGPVSAKEFAEMTAATTQIFPHTLRLSEIRIASNHGEIWGSASSKAPPVTARVFFKKMRTGTWREVGGSSGCLFATDLGMPQPVGRALGTCSHSLPANEESMEALRQRRHLEFR